MASPNSLMPGVHGETARCTASRMRSSARASSTHSPPATTTFDLKLMSLKISPPEAAGAGEEGEGRQAHGCRGGYPQPGDDLGDRQRQLDLPEELALGQAHPAAGVLRLLGHVVEAGEDVAEDDQQRVGHEGDERGCRAAARDREQEEERRQARDRVEDSGDVHDRTDEPAAAVSQQRQRERDGESDDHGHDREVDVVPEGIDVAIEVVPDPVRAEAVVGHAALLREVLADLDLGEDHSLPPPIFWTDAAPMTRPASSRTASRLTNSLT